MKIFVEGFYYDYSLIKKCFNQSLISLNITKDKKRAAIQNVGYIKTVQGNICIILPKVFLNNGYLFNNIPPEEILDESKNKLNLFKRYGKSQKDLDFLCNFSIKLYRVLKTYMQNHNSEDLTNHIRTNIKENENSLLDVIFSLIDIYQSNKYLYMKNRYLSLNKPKINWKKTIKRKLPYLDINENPLYLEVISEKPNYSQEDILLTIFFSVLNDLEVSYGFNISLEQGLPIIKGHEYKKLSLKALKILKRIRGKYFNDVLKNILYLLILYFQKIDFSKSKTKQDKPEYLLTSNFNLIFEDMVDVIISDPEDLRLFKEQEDGKILDHIYHDSSIVSNTNTFYIGDSKYYQDGSKIGNESKFKQFTYARNLIDVYVNPSNKQYQYLLEKNIILRDTNTEGYNIIPNFFILGKLNHLDYSNITEPPITYINVVHHKHFPNRLFDRDTISVLYFELNFLFAVNAYLNKNQTAMLRQKIEVRKLIKNAVISFYENNYVFFELHSDHIDHFIKKAFYLLNGKIIRNFSNENSIILALEKSETKELEKIFSLCRKYSIKPLPYNIRR
jgi:hypothetical protein